MRKNLLIGAIINYTWDDVAPFFNSFKAAGFENCDCVMFVGNMSERTINRMKSCGADIKPIPDKYLNGRIVLYRFELFYEFLKDKADKYNMILTADVRDVIFQRDLFKLCGNSPFLGVAVEDGPLSPRYSEEWILNVYGREVHNAVKDKNTICMGTVWGTSKEFIDFVGALNYELKHGPKPYSRMNDQGSANVMISYRKMFEDILRPNTNYDGYVMTLGFMPNKYIKQDSYGNVLNVKGEAAAVVHQYDRRPKIVSHVAAKYTEGVSVFFWLDLRIKRSLAKHIVKFLKMSYWNGLASAVRFTMKWIRK